MYYQQYNNRPAAAYQVPDPQSYFPENSWAHGWFSVTEPNYLKGLLVGAGVAFLLTNPKVQHALIKGAVNLWTTVQGGFEEVKEQIEDLKSEMSAKTGEDQ